MTVTDFLLAFIFGYFLLAFLSLLPFSRKAFQPKIYLWEAMLLSTNWTSIKLIFGSIRNCIELGLANRAFYWYNLINRKFYRTGNLKPRKRPKNLRKKFTP